MSELIDTRANRTFIRCQLLATASALAFHVCFANGAMADDQDRPPVWIELGGQADLLQGTSRAFTAPFMFADPTSEVYRGNALIENQKPARLSLGLEGKITLQPTGSDWIFTAGVRYGRSHRNGHVHNQTPGRTVAFYTLSSHAVAATYLLSSKAFLDSTIPSKEHHLVLDFSVGRDVGIGFLGHDGSSRVNAGIRLLDLGENSTSTIYARPDVGVAYLAPKYVGPVATFQQYAVTAHEVRSFRGVGPSLSWNASAGLLGNQKDGELMLDWGINAALLFGRQKAKTDHSTQAQQLVPSAYNYHLQYGALYPSRSSHRTSSRRVTVPNLGGFAGLSVKYPNVKFSLGYRADVFFNAMDTGIDARKETNLTFNGPYASFSIGLGN